MTTSGSTLILINASRAIPRTNQIGSSVAFRIVGRATAAFGPMPPSAIIADPRSCSFTAVLYVSTSDGDGGRRFGTDLSQRLEDRARDWNMLSGFARDEVP